MVQFFYREKLETFAQKTLKYFCTSRKIQYQEAVDHETKLLTGKVRKRRKPWHGSE